MTGTGSPFASNFEQESAPLKVRLGNVVPRATTSVTSKDASEHGPIFNAITWIERMVGVGMFHRIQ